MINWQPTLENDLVKLAPLHARDFERLYEAASDPLIWEQHPQPDRYQRDAFQKGFFEGALACHTAFLISEKATGAVMGSTRFYDIKPDSSSVAIGFTFLARSYWGGTYNFACKKLLLDYAFQHVTDVLFHIGVNNLRSQKALLRLGGIKLGAVDFYQTGNGISHFEYVIRKEEWEKTLPS